MKITCKLVSWETGKEITSHEVEANRFGLTSNNPFPCSDIWSGIVFNDELLLKYKVDKAFGDLGSTIDPEEGLWPTAA
jgi:hypothetical protein